MRDASEIVVEAPPAAAACAQTSASGGRRLSTQFAIYVAIGIASAGLDIATLFALLRLGVDYRAATAIAFVVALVFNYFLHVFVTFQTRTTARSMFRYGVLVGVNFVLTMAFVVASKDVFDSVLIGKIASLPTVAVVGFLGGRLWAFRPH